MDLDVVFLGTAGSVPTAQRGLNSALIRRGGERILIDCGEGTQRQMMRSVGMADIDTVLVTHLHADHYLGLPGMLKTFTLRERELPLRLAGPPGTRQLFSTLASVIGKLSFPLTVHDVEPGWSMPGAGYVIETFATHHTVRSVGFRLREHDRPGRFDTQRARELGVEEGPLWGALQRGQPVDGADGRVTPDMVLGHARVGRTIVFTGDTRAHASIRAAAQDADLLVHEATFASEERERAGQTGHSTAHDAAITAAGANVRMLAITHVSNRYSGRELVEEARQVFEHAVCPRDFDLIDVPFRERGEPSLVKGGGRHVVDARHPAPAEA